MDTTLDAWNWALKKLSRRNRTSHEIRMFLVQKGFPTIEVENTILKLIDYRFLDDENFARVWIRELSKSGKGPRAIATRLKSKGLNLTLDRITHMISADTGRTELENAIELLRRRYSDAHENPKQKKRAFDALVRRGFSFAVARQALDLIRSSD